MGIELTGVNSLYEPEEEWNQDPGTGLGHPQTQPGETPPQQHPVVSIVGTPAFHSREQPSLFPEQSRDGLVPEAGSK